MRVYLCFLALTGLVVFTGCETTNPQGSLRMADPAMTAEPAVVPPLDAKNRGLPVLLKPVTAVSWVKPTQEGKSWKGGYLTVDILEDWRWATREEAESLGRPYIVPGESDEIVPAGVGGSEIRIGELMTRLNRLENNQPRTVDRMEAEQALVSGMGQVPPQVMTDGPTLRGTPNQFEVPEIANTPAPTRTPSMEVAAAPKKALRVTIPWQPAGSEVELPIEGTNEPLRVRYKENGKVVLSWKGYEQEVLWNSGQVLQVTPP